MKELRTIDWAMSRLGGVSREALYKWARGGVVPCVHIGRRVLFDEIELDAWIAAGGTRNRTAIDVIRDPAVDAPA